MDNSMGLAAWLVGKDERGMVLLQVANLTNGQNVTLSLPPNEAHLLASQLLLQVDHANAVPSREEVSA